MFNRNWELIGLHVGRGEFSNFGINIKSIIEDAQERLSGIAITDEVQKKIKQLDNTCKSEYFSVFISYNHLDSVFANRLYNALQANGIRAWIDVESMLPGDNIYKKYKKELMKETKYCFVVQSHL